LIKFILAVCSVICCAFTVQTAPAKAVSSNCSTASYYGIGDGYHGKITASGERFNAYALTAAHRTLPFGTKLKITDQQTKRSVIVRINDRGPFVSGREVDLSYGAFASIANPGRGVLVACVSRVLK